MANKIQYAVPTIEQFVAMHPEVCAMLTEQEQRICAKTAINLALAWDESKKKALDYCAMTPIQRAALKSFADAASKAGKLNPLAAMAMENLGLN